jgi:hypothetical protein
MPAHSYPGSSHGAARLSHESLTQELPIPIQQDPDIESPWSYPPNDSQIDGTPGENGEVGDDDNVSLLHPHYISAKARQYPPSPKDQPSPPAYKSPKLWRFESPLKDGGYTQFSDGTPIATPADRSVYPQVLRSPPSLKTRKRSPFGSGFEIPQWRQLSIHFILCAITYPCLIFFIMMAKGTPLFYTRIFVGAGCGIMGFALGLSLMELAKGIIEACSMFNFCFSSIEIPN